jgi:hypothetical protein
MSGKGSLPRPLSVDQSVFESNWETIFGKNPQETDDAKAEDEAFSKIENSTLK